MDVEKIIVKYMADATQFNAVTDATERRLEMFASNMTGLGRRIFEVVAGGIAYGFREVAGRVGDLMDRVATKVGNTYAKLEARYGKNWARAIIGAGVAGLPIPLPGASMMLAGPFLLLAELSKRLGNLNVGSRLQFGIDYGKAFLAGFWETVKDGFKDLLSMALQRGAVPLGIATGIYNSVGKALAPIRNFLVPIFADMWQGIITRSFFQGTVGTAIVNAFHSVMGGAVARRIGGVLSAVWSAPIVQAIPGAVMGAARRALSGVQSLVGGAFSVGQQAVGAGLNTAFGVLGAGAGLLGSILSGGFEMVLAPAKVALLGLGAAAAYAGYEAIRLASAYEQASISFTVMTGSADKAKELLSDLTKLAIETPFKSSELIKQAQTLKAYGVETEDLIDTLKVLGDVASGGSGGSLDDRLGRIALAFGQVITQGRLTGQELRQFANAGVPLLESLAKVTGKPTESIKGLIEEGRIGAREVTQAFNAMVGPGGRFFNLMNEQSKSVEGRWSAFVENIQLGLRNLGLSFFKGFGLADLLDQWGKATQQLGGQTQELEGFFGRLREVFDMLSTAGSAVGKILLEGIGEAIKMLTGFAPSWDDLKQSIDLTIQAAITGIGKLIELLGKAAAAMADILEAAGRMAKMAGIGTGDDKGIYGASRERGNSKIIAGLETLGGNAIGGIASLFGYGKEYDEELQKRGKISPDTGNPFQTGVDMLRGLSSQGGNPADKMLAEYKKMREMQDQQAAAARAAASGGTGGGFFDRMAQMARDQARASHIREKVEPSADAKKMIGEVNKAFAGGESPLAKLRIDMKAFESAVTNGYGFKMLDEFGQFGFNPGSALTQRQQEFQAGRLLDGMRQAVGSLEVKFPSMIAKGSAEAQDAINRTIYDKPLSVQEEMRALLEQMKDMDEERLRIEKEANEALQELIRSGVAIPGAI